LDSVGKMGDRAQLSFLNKVSSELSIKPRRIIYSGAAVGDNDFSALFPNSELHTTDIDQSGGIDVIWDLEEDPAPEIEGAYDLFISTSVLEHVRRPWIAAKNMEKTVAHGGYLYISVPWVWDFHEFPGDYWRFSHQTLDVIFEGSDPVSTAWNTYPDCILYNHDPYIDREMMLRSIGTLPNGTQFNRRGVPLLQINQLRRMK